MIDLIAAAGIGGIVSGALVYLAMKEKTTAFLANRDYWVAEYDLASDALLEANAAHARCSDALETARNRIERALSCETPKAAHGVKKMARLLRGEEA